MREHERTAPWVNRLNVAFSVGLVGGLLVCWGSIEAEQSTFGRPAICAQESEDLSYAVFVGTSGDIERAKCVAFGDNCGGPDPLPPGVLHHRFEDDYAHYYEDVSKVGGMDCDQGEGVDVSDLNFYLGHADWDAWAARLGRAPVADLVLGNRTSNVCDGGARYFLMCACRIMAHGPFVASRDYWAPDAFVPTAADNAAMRNAFARWKDVLGQDFRLACGGSSLICDGSREIGADFLREYGGAACPMVPEAYIRAFVRDYEAPVCMSRGGPRPEQSALWDEAFSSRPASSEGWLEEGTEAYLHLQYLANAMYRPESASSVHRSASGVVRELADLPLPRYIPISRAGNETFMPLEGRLRERFELSEFRTGERGHYRSARFENPNEKGGVWIDRNSGSVHVVKGRAIMRALAVKSCSSVVFGERSRLLASVWNLWGVFEGSPDGEEWYSKQPKIMCIQSTPVSSQGTEIQRYWKSTWWVLVRSFPVRRLLPEGYQGGERLNELSIGTVGPGGRVIVEFGPGMKSEDVFGLSRIVRPIDEQKLAKVPRVPILTRESALAKARAKLVEEHSEFEEGYETDPDWWDFGYKEESGNCIQDRLYLVFQFRFRPRESDSLASPEGGSFPPPLFVEVLAQEWDSPPTIGCEETLDGTGGS